MNREQNILAGINRILSCPKLLLTLASVIGGFFAIRHAGAGLSDDAKVKLWIGFIGAVALLLREVINAWTEQDVANINSTTPVFLPPGTAQAYQDAEPPAPASQPKPAAPAPASVASNPPAPAPATIQRAPVNMQPMSSAPRLPARPPRTVLPPIQ